MPARDQDEDEQHVPTEQCVDPGQVEQDAAKQQARPGNEQQEVSGMVMSGQDDPTKRQRAPQQEQEGDHGPPEQHAAPQKPAAVDGNQAEDG
jgi:hypothetical protein